MNQRVGAVYIYNFNGMAWVNIQTIYGNVADNHFGSAVDINQFGTYAAISEYNALSAGHPSAGVVNIYNKPASLLTFQTALSDPSPADYEHFGITMAMSSSGNYVLVGAPLKTVSNHFGNGYVGLFNRSGSTWTQVQTFSPDAEDDLGIGTQVDVTDTHAMFSVAKTKTVYFFEGLDLAWGGNIDPPFTSAITSVAIDPVTDMGYVMAGSTIYPYSPNGISIKTISEPQPTGFTQLLSVFNKNYLMGFPVENSAASGLTGAVYFGVSQY